MHGLANVKLNRFVYLNGINVFWKPKRVFVKDWIIGFVYFVRSKKKSLTRTWRYVDINLYTTVANIVCINVQFIISDHCVWSNASFILYNQFHLASPAFETKTFQLRFLNSLNQQVLKKYTVSQNLPCLSGEEQCWFIGVSVSDTVGVGGRSIAITPLNIKWSGVLYPF